MSHGSVYSLKPVLPWFPAVTITCTFSGAPWHLISLQLKTVLGLSLAWTATGPQPADGVCYLPQAIRIAVPAARTELPTETV